MREMEEDDGTAEHTSGRGICSSSFWRIPRWTEDRVWFWTHTGTRSWKKGD